MRTWIRSIGRHRHREKGGSVAHIDASRDEVDAAVKGGEFGLGASSFGAAAGGESPKADVIDATPKEPKATKKKKAGGNGKYHVLLTANDAVYVRWQSRIMYHQYKKIAADPALAGAMGGFTRILHSGKPDDLMDEIPTVIVDPLPKGIKDHGYVVLHRPYAFKQWLDTYARDIEEEFVLMTEPDHLYLRGMPLFATPEHGGGVSVLLHRPEEQGLRTDRAKVQRGQGAHRRLRAHR